ncbi:MAG: signal peptidase I [Deltaproteobacteria bacterium]|nr:signal peptidase I [Deltaproteobacteria bacterium]
MFRPTYKLDQQTLKELRQIGLDDNMDKALSKLVDRRFTSRRSFLKALDGQVSSPIPKDDRKLLAQHAYLGWFGLHHVIPNRVIREWVEALGFAIFVAFLIIRPFIVAPYVIPSVSMVPTILVGDRIFATKFSYGLYNPLGGKKILARSVSRGDIVIFPYPRDPSVDYIKRVVGLPGETVEMRNRVIYINGTPLSEPYAYWDQTMLSRYAAVNQLDEAFNYGPIQVPPDHLFVMGDNRLNSADSRVWGFVPVNEVAGKAWIIYWSHDSDLSLLEGYHLSRIGSLLK